MGFSTRIILGATLLLATSPVAGDDAGHYGAAPFVPPAGGQPVYPAGTSDPSFANPPGPPPETAVPMPPSALPVGATPAGPPVWSPSGPASPSNVAPPAVYPSASAAQIYPAPPGAVQGEKPAQASWYTRAEYFHWNEHTNGTNFVNEDGVLFTLGYSRQIGIERFRAELFGGEVHYAGYDQSDNGALIPLSSNTGYLGVRGDYELVLAPAVWEGRLAVLAGLGTRFWIRDLHDGTDADNNPVWGYQETWWTTYPYLGLETHRSVGENLDLYSESRMGATALTYQFASINQRPLWPRVGLFANAEMGLRGPRFFIAARAEVMSLAQSSVVQDPYQPNSLMVTAGGRLGFMF